MCWVQNTAYFQNSIFITIYNNFAVRVFKIQKERREGKEGEGKEGEGKNPQTKSLDTNY